MTDSRKKRMILYSVLFAVSAVFYLFWYWHDGIIITPDAQSYIDMISARDPGYSFSYGYVGYLPAGKGISSWQ